MYAAGKILTNGEKKTLSVKWEKSDWPFLEVRDTSPPDFAEKTRYETKEFVDQPFFASPSPLIRRSPCLLIPHSGS
jgi:hypothetical protein